MDLRECPFCHIPLEAQMLSKEQVDSSEVTNVGDFPMGRSSLLGGVMEGGLVMNQGSLALGLSEGERQTVAMNPEAFITYKFSYQCKHCGKKWTKLEVEAKPLPREYVEDDQEKTDYDAHVEEEEAREDDYSREP